ncbi:hypothetical protein ACFQU3_07105 [Terrabacter sp. GCM10028922]|uniref:hypothetical protein n=1 Tax=Terrabacter sp. GCM10028922 TaxID=3273428 RepID=UPI0036171876
MSENPPHPPDAPGVDPEVRLDPTRDAAGEETGPAEPADLPADPPTGVGIDGGVHAYGVGFGVQPPPQPSWVPPRAAPGHPATGEASPWTPHAPTRPVRTVTLGGAVGRALGGRVQAWHVVAAAAGLLIPVGFALASSLGSDLEPIDRPVVGVTRSRPLVTPTFQAPSITLLPGQPPSKRTPSASIGVPQTTPTTRSVMTAPPPVIPVPALPVTPVPTDATRVRFEAYAEKGARIEVSVSDAGHQPYDYPVQASPLAFETTISPNVSSNDYVSMRVRIHDPSGSGSRGSVSCRVLVDGIVVRSQQGRGYATCHLMPYYEIRRP